MSDPERNPAPSSSRIASEPIADPAKVLEIYSLANAKQAAGDYREAERLIREILRPDFVEAHLALGNALLGQERIDEAIACYERALRVNPDYQAARSNLQIAREVQSRQATENARWVGLVAQRDYVYRAFGGMDDESRFMEGFSTMLGTLPAGGRFAGDNLITWGRNLSFLDDRALIDSVAKNSASVLERTILWRTAVLVWAARNGLRRDGDFVECGSWRGTTARELCDAVNIGATGKKFWLYDVFDWSADQRPDYFSGTDLQDLHAIVAQRFADLPCVQVIKGYVPESFTRGSPEKISFMHIDMNNAPAEVGALEALWDRVIPGGMVVLDDYGWEKYRAQKLAEDEFFHRRGYTILELPTGQGLVLK